MRLSTRNMILVSMFAALTAIGAFIKIEIPYVPITLQFFFSALSGVILGSKKGALSQLVYVFVGLIGFPVFTKGGGPMYVFIPTFGYLIGFIVNSYIIGKILESFKRVNVFKIYFAVISGLMMVYVIGVPYLYMIYNVYMNKPMSVSVAVKAGMLTSVWKDALVAVVVAVVSAAIMPRLNRALRLGRNNFERDAAL